MEAVAQSLESERRGRKLAALRLLEELRECFAGDAEAHKLVEELRRRLWRD